MPVAPESVVATFGSASVTFISFDGVIGFEQFTELSKLFADSCSCQMPSTWSYRQCAGMSARTSASAASDARTARAPCISLGC